MNIANNLFILVFALLPIIFYVYLLYSWIPKTYVSIDRGRRYFISGLMSPFLIFLIYFIFPNWSNSISNSEMINYFFFAIVQIGILEELSKYTIFNWVSSERISQKYDLPIATVFYCSMTALGFALTENISYLINLYQENSYNPLITQTQLNNSMLRLAFNRSISAVVMHINCGIILGYFISIYNEKKKREIENTKDNLKHKPLIGNFKYVIFGIVLAALYHGIYDLNLILPENNYKMFFTIITIGYGLIISYFMFKNLIEKSRIKRICKMN